jgi:hypothetical protein
MDEFNKSKEVVPLPHHDENRTLIYLITLMSPGDRFAIR